MKYWFFLFYFSTLLFFSLFTYSFVDPNLFYFKNLYTGFSTEHRTIATSVYVLFVFLFFLLYFLFLWMVYKQKVQKNELFWIIGGTVAILIFSYPAMLSYDIFNYITTAKVTFFYHENPYIIMPIEFIGEPFLSFTRAANKIALYGPFWILLTGIPFFLSFGNFIFMLLSFKFFVSVFYIAIVMLLWKMTKNVYSVAVFALNPLVIIETLVSGHNDIVMMFFAVLSFYFVKRSKFVLGIMAIILSIFIKYATIVLLPILLYVVWKIIREQKLRWDSIFTACIWSMFFVFLLSPLREEIYSWYAVWYLVFIPLIYERKVILYTSMIFSFGLMLRYVPYMFFGTYLSPTPLLKNIFSNLPPFLFLIYYVFKKKI